MVHPLRTLRSLFSADDGTGVEEAADHHGAATDGGPSETGEFVHECPGCGEVYLSETPHSCSSCGETTTAVPTTDD